MHPADDPRLTLGHFLRDVAARHGARRALVFEGSALSYAGLEAEVQRLARALLGAGVVKGARVALLLSSRPEWIAAAFAVGRLGGVLVPVNTFATREELDHILRHSDASLLLLQPALLKHRFLDELLLSYPELESGRAGRLRCPALPQLRRIFCLGLPAPRGGVETWEALLAEGRDVPDALVDAASAEVVPSDDACIIYTSGSTALPKAVLHSQRAAALQSYRYVDFLRLEPDDVIYTTYPFFWTAGMAMSIGGAFAAGACLIVEESFDPARALATIERERATVLHAWPHQHRALAEQPGASERDLSSLRKLDFASPVAALAGLEKDLYGYGCSYGLSETFTLATATPADAPAELRKSCHGQVLPDTLIRIVDPETGAPLPPGEEGEIIVKGATFMRGYYKLPPERYLDENGFFHTQDGGFFDAQGFLHWSGRLSNVIKTGGANVSPIEIERALDKLEGLKAGVVVGIPHPTLGELLVLCAVPQEGASLGEDEVRRFLRGKLAAYKVPRRVLFFRAEELSLTANQKIQVAPLREAAQRRLAAEGALIEGHRYGPPAG